MNCNTPTDVTFSFTGFAQRGGAGVVGCNGRGRRAGGEEDGAREGTVAAARAGALRTYRPRQGL